MSDIKMTLNGLPPKEYKLQDLLKSALLELTIEKIEHKVSEALTAEEARRITIELTGKNAGDLSFEVRGPKQIVKKVKAVLAYGPPSLTPPAYR